MSNAPATLAELVAPLSQDEFVTLLRERKLTFLRGVGGERYSALLTWPVLLQMIARGEHPSSLAEFVLVKDSQVAPPERWLKQNPAGEGNVVDVSKLLAFLNHGFSLSVARINDYAPHLKVLCQNIRAMLREQIKVGAIVTTGPGGAFKLHFDPEDLIILQVEGRKRWKIFGPPVINPVVGMKSTVTPPPEDTLLFDEILAPGDFLFLPAGNWHRCENQSNRSLHLGIFFQPPNGLDIVKAITSSFMADEALRAPLSRDANLSALGEDIKARAIDRIGKLDLEAFLAEFGGQ